MVRYLIIKPIKKTQEYNHVYMHVIKLIYEGKTSGISFNFQFI